MHNASFSTLVNIFGFKLFFLWLIFSLAGFNTFGQKLKISGIIRDQNTGLFSRPKAVLNDTLARFANATKPLEDSPDLEAWTRWTERFQKLSGDTSLVSQSDSTGKFSLVADLRDSIVFYSYEHYPKRYAVSDLLKIRPLIINLIKIPCVPYIECDAPAEKLFVFVGEKISVQPGERVNYCERFLLDSRYEARYKIIKNIYGDYKGDSISFTVYDHYGVPAFSQHQYVLLFVSQYCGKLYHEKYQYFDVYPTENGRWASPGNPYRSDKPDSTKIIPQKIGFGKLNFDKIIDQRKRGMQFTEPYFKIEGNCVTPVLGAYAEELFEVKKSGTLKARGFKFN